MNRRDFLRLSALTAAGLLVESCARGRTGTLEAVTAPAARSPRPKTGGFFSLHPFIETHPEAVFIKRTNVGLKTDAEAKQQEGARLAREIFVFGATMGIPLSCKIAIKPNLTSTEGMGNREGGMGIITDTYFMEGMIEGMKRLGFQAQNMYISEGNWLKDGICVRDLHVTGYPEMAERTGIHLLDLPSGRRITELTLADLEEGTEVIWKDCPEGVVFRRIGYVAPFNGADSWLLNVAKLKAHGMGMTLCVKNLQGTCATPFIHFCESIPTTLKHPAPIRKYFQPDLEKRLQELHARHLEAGIPRWDRPGLDASGGYGMEMWAQRTCDSLSVTKAGFSIIEGIYGRNGDGFMRGPGPKGEAEDFMTNVLIFGKNPFRVDMIGTWLAGHEPRNFGLFHIAKERGLSTVLNPAEIPVYLWRNGNPQLTALTDLERVPLKSCYLPRDYNGHHEARYHMVDES